MAKAPETLNLVPAIREVEAQIHRLTVEFEEKIKPYISEEHTSELHSP